MNNIRTSDKTVIKTGTVIFDKPDNQIYIPFEIGESSSGEICFQFLDNDTGETTVSTKFDNSTFYIIGYNLNDPIGRGLIRPLNVGTINNKAIELQFVTRVIGGENKVRTLDFTLYMEV